MVPISYLRGKQAQQYSLVDFFAQAPKTVLPIERDSPIGRAMARFPCRRPPILECAGTGRIVSAGATGNMDSQPGITLRRAHSTVDRKRMCLLGPPFRRLDRRDGTYAQNDLDHPQ